MSRAFLPCWALQYIHAGPWQSHEPVNPKCSLATLRPKRDWLPGAHSMRDCGGSTVVRGGNTSRSRNMHSILVTGEPDTTIHHVWECQNSASCKKFDIWDGRGQSRACEKNAMLLEKCKTVGAAEPPSACASRVHHGINYAKCKKTP